MKKSVVIIIALIYLVAIALVSFFGLQFKVFEQIIPVERIEILNEGLKENATWGKYVVIQKNAEGEWKYQIDYRVYPDDATDTRVSFSYDSQAHPGVSIDETGVVTFTTSDMVKVKIISMDGGNVETTITIIAK